MVRREGSQPGPRVLLVSDDDHYSHALKAHLTGMTVLSLPESSVWVAIRAGLDVTRGVHAVLLDRGVTGRLQLRLYETLRPADSLAQAPVVFMRSRLTAASGGFDHPLDVYQPEDAPLEQAGRLVRHALALVGVSCPGQLDQPDLPPSGVAARMAAVAASTRRKPIALGPGALGPGALQRVGLWGVAVALISFTFWPLLGSGPVRDAVFGPIKAFSSESAKLANSPSKPRAER